MPNATLGEEAVASVRLDHDKYMQTQSNPLDVLIAGCDDEELRDAAEAELKRIQASVTTTHSDAEYIYVKDPAGEVIMQLQARLAAAERGRDEWEAKAMEFMGIIQELRVILKVADGNIQKGRTLLRGKEQE